MTEPELAENEAQPTKNGSDEQSESEQSDDGMSQSKFRQLITQGYTYREDYTFEMFGEEVDIQLQPLTDDIYRHLLEQMEEDIGDEKFKELLNQKRSGDLEVNDDGEVESLDADVALGQIGALRLAAKYGIDPKSVGETREGVVELVDKMVGQRSIEIGMEVMSVTADVGEFDDFPGARGR